jgi:hypothetical protein
MQAAIRHLRQYEGEKDDDMGFKARKLDGKMHLSDPDGLSSTACGAKNANGFTDDPAHATCTTCAEYAARNPEKFDGTHRLERPATKAHEHKRIDAKGFTACGRQDDLAADPEKFQRFTEPPPDYKIITADCWLRIDCRDCLAKMPDPVHALKCVGRAFADKFEFDEDDPKRWGATIALCGVELGAATGLHVADRHDGITCLDCMVTLAERDRYHKKAANGGHTSTLCGGKPGSTHPWPSASWIGVSCPDCWRVRQREPVASFIEDGAAIVLHNALVAARKDGLQVRRGGCRRCIEPGAPESAICLACALLRTRDAGAADVDAATAAVLGLPAPWVVDLLAGFDGDAKHQAYRTAYLAGRKLWRKHGARP